MGKSKTLVRGYCPVDPLLNPSYWNRTETTDLVRLDILLTLGMMRYVADQREGRMEPRSVDPELLATSRDVAVD